MTNRFVLDASALLALIFGEPGASLVSAKLQNSIISAVNYSEVVIRLIEKAGTLQTALERTLPAKLPVIPFDESQSIRAADLRATTAQYGLSFADRACLALAMQENAIVLTADQDWANVSLPITIKLIRSRKP